MRECKHHEVFNPRTKRCFKKAGKIGKKIIASVEKKERLWNEYEITKSKRKRVETLIIKLQSLVRGYLYRLKILPLILYQIRNYLVKNKIELSKCSNDGRISSCIDENIITEKLKNNAYFKDKIKIPKERWWYDVLIRDHYYGWLPVNIKTTTTKTADNTGNLAMCVQAYTDEEVLLHPPKKPRTKISKPSTNNGSMSKILINKLQNKCLNYKAKKDYYFIVVNKTNGDVIVNSVKGLVELTSNLHNIPFQIRWNKNSVFMYGNIKDKVNMFLRCMQVPQCTWEEKFLRDIRGLPLIL